MLLFIRTACLWLRRQNENDCGWNFTNNNLLRNYKNNHWHIKAIFTSQSNCYGCVFQQVRVHLFTISLMKIIYNGLKWLKVNSSEKVVTSFLQHMDWSISVVWAAAMGFYDSLNHMSVYIHQLYKNKSQETWQKEEKV